LGHSYSDKSPQEWEIKDSAELYEIDQWGDKYFSINKDGNIQIAPQGKEGPHIDLYKLTKELNSRKVNLPLIIRFNDILKDRIDEINNAFLNAIKTYKYKNIYQGVFPIKCNQERHLIEKIINFGEKWDLGLEAGSKSELLISLSTLKNKNALIICNGYKDHQYIETAILARKLGLKPIIVIEQRDEVFRIIEAVKTLGAFPIIGIRAKLSSKSIGRWGKSIGEKSKFGLSIPEIMDTVKDLKKANLLNELKLLHFHIGSQISDIAIIKDALQEASQIYTEIVHLGAPMEYLDVGGGLGIDYDGSKTSFNASTNYSLQNYANDVVATINDCCELNNINHPIIISESGRSIASHFSVLIFNILGTSTIKSNIDDNYDNQSIIIKNLFETLNNIKELRNKEINLSKIIELWNDAKKFKDDSLAAFRLGYMNLQDRALSEQLTWSCAKEISAIMKKTKTSFQDLQDLEITLASTYYANLSIFRSIPDSWAIKQLFPIMPIHKLKEKPNLPAKFADLTCDSDGRLANFINNGTTKQLLNLHEFSKDNEYILGIFLVGAYQEVMGNFHNLFGNTNTIHININQDNKYNITNIIKEDSKSDVLKAMNYNPEQIIENIRLESELSIHENSLNIKEARKLLDQIESSLQNSTYFSG
tara:strand:- start:6917 stop:8860 length:1944 start_codon:yes stop_codon:yes gene_type:complete